MEKLYLGVAREIITPKIGGQLYGYRPNIFSERVADDLTATAFYFRQGDKECILISVTVCSVQTELNDSILQQIQEQTGIAKENCILCAIHTHSGPNVTGGTGWGDIDAEYRDEIFMPRVLSAAKKAAQAAVPVTMGVASGNSYVGVNRRELTLDNKIVFGQSPWSCFNPKMTVISFRDEAGNQVANLIHYGAHCTGSGHNHEITRDWAGVMIDGLEKESGAITAFINGPEGDVGPRLSNGRTIGDLAMAYELGAIGAEDAKRIYGQIADYTVPQLQVCAKNCEVPYKPRMTKEEAQALYEQFKDNTVNISGKRRATALEVLESYEKGMVEKKSDNFLQTMIALGDTVLVSFPYEPFSEIGLRIDKAFPNAQILSIALANGSKGYFITEDAICRGGYEVNCFVYEGVQSYVENADWYLVQNTVENIKNIIKEEE